MTSTVLPTLDRPPPVPVIVSVNEPVWTLPGSVTVNVETKPGVPDVTLKTPLTPDGRPDIDRVTGELKPLMPTTSTENDATSPCLTVSEGGLTSIWKSLASPTMSLKVAEWVFPPPIPVTVNVYVPGEAESVTVRVSDVENVGLPDGWASVPATPGGSPARLRATLLLVPDKRVAVTV